MQPRQVKLGGGGSGGAHPVLSRAARYGPARRSTRLQGVKLEEGAMCELSDDEDGKGPREGSWGLLDLMGEWRPRPLWGEGGKEGGEQGLTRTPG